MEGRKHHNSGHGGRRGSTRSLPGSSEAGEDEGGSEREQSESRAGGGGESKQSALEIVGWAEGQEERAWGIALSFRMQRRLAVCSIMCLPCAEPVVRRHPRTARYSNPATPPLLSLAWLPRLLSSMPPPFLSISADFLITVFPLLSCPRYTRTVLVFINAWISIYVAEICRYGVWCFQ